MEYLLGIAMLFYCLFVLAISFALDYRKQNQWLKQKNEGYRSALLAYMMYRYRDLARIERLEAQIQWFKDSPTEHFNAPHGEIWVYASEREALDEFMQILGDAKVCEFGRGKTNGY